MRWTKSLLDVMERDSSEVDKEAILCSGREIG